MSSSTRTNTNTVSAILVASFCLITAVGLMSSDAGAAFTRNQAGGLTEGLLVEAQVSQGTNVIAGRVLIEAGRTEWTTIASSPATGKGKAVPLKLEARATLLDNEIVEVETRVTGGQEQTGKLIVRLGESGVMTSSQMESAESAAGTPAPLETSVGVKVLRVRYSL